MASRRRAVPAGRFKSQCLAMLDRVARTGEEIVVTKRGKPIARVVPLDDQRPPGLKGSVVREADLVSPLDVDWDAER